MEQNGKNINWDNVLNDLDQARLSDDLRTEEEIVLSAELLKIKNETSSLLQDYKDYHTKAQWNKLKAVIDHSEAKRTPIALWLKVAGAAAVLFILSISYYFVVLKAPLSDMVVEIQSTDVAPGGKKAMLTLANGRKIVLSDVKNGMLAEDGDAEISKDVSGVRYSIAGKSQSNVVSFNTLSTPRGGTYQLRLVDGTLVVLNSNSSITFPTSFSGVDREVKISGEVYFEVSHNASMPFKVISRKQKIEVLGTHFNVNTYEDEPDTKTTLLEGSVKITNDLNQILYLKPGEQAKNSATLALVPKVSAETAIAWKNGFFHFDNADISTIMRNFSRWYDVDVAYTGAPTNRRFTGDIHRDMTLSKALEILSYLKVHFKIEGKKIIVNNKL